MIKRIVIYFLIVTAALYLLRYLHYRGLLRQDKGYYGKLKTIFITKNNYPVLFLGSSRAEMHYDTHVFDSITGQNSFNIGLPGAMPNMAYSVLKAYLANSHPPKHIIYEVDYQILKFYTQEISDFNNYFPFLSNKILRSEFGKIDPRMNGFYYNPYLSLPFTGLKNISTGIHGWLSVPNPTDGLFHKGFFAENFENSLNYIKARRAYVFVHPRNRAYLDSIITLCKENNIHLTFATSPFFAAGAVEMQNRLQVIKQVENIAKINGIEYYNLSALPFCFKREYFLDHQHMKRAGSRFFTIELARIVNNKSGIRSLK